MCVPHATTQYASVVLYNFYCWYNTGIITQYVSALSLASWCLWWLYHICPLQIVTQSESRFTTQSVTIVLLLNLPPAAYYPICITHVAAQPTQELNLFHVVT